METKLTFVQLYKNLLDTDLTELKYFQQTLDEIEAEEDSVQELSNQTVLVKTKTLPVIVGSDIKVKVVILETGDACAIIMPDNVADNFELLSEDLDKVAQVNLGIDLVAETYGFTVDKEFKEEVKKIYVAANNSEPAFTISKQAQLAQLAQEEKEEEELEDFERDHETFSRDIDFSDEELLSGLEPNNMAFESFKKETKSLEKLINKLYNSVGNKIKPLIKVATLKENLLIFEVNNTEIYQTLREIPTFAKGTISFIGETIRTNKDTQLVDTFTTKDKRYFIVAEAVNNNFWYVEGEKLAKSSLNENKIKPLKENIIKLSKSSVVNRKYDAIKDGDSIYFVISKGNN